MPAGLFLFAGKRIQESRAKKEVALSVKFWHERTLAPAGAKHNPFGMRKAAQIKHGCAFSPAGSSNASEGETPWDRIQKI
jgi:hypothetical protein